VPLIFTELVIGAMMIVATVSIHALFMAVLIERFRAHPPKLHSGFRRTAANTLVVVWFFLAIAAESWTWALLFYYLGGFQDIETALYFSTVTYTTLGYGDVVLGKDLRLLGAFAAANGTIIVGWTTALVFLAAEQVYELRSPRKDR
jgi:hypothetical protein